MICSWTARTTAREQQAKANTQIGSGRSSLPKQPRDLFGDQEQQAKANTQIGSGARGAPETAPRPFWISKMQKTSRIRIKNQHFETSLLELSSERNIMRNYWYYTIMMIKSVQCKCFHGNTISNLDTCVNMLLVFSVLCFAIFIHVLLMFEVPCEHSLKFRMRPDIV